MRCVSWGPLGLAAILLTGCASEKLVGRPGLETVSNGLLPAPTQSDLMEQRRPYVLGPNDKISVIVYGIPELSGSAQLDANGEFSLPLVGTLDAAGKSSSQIAELVTQRLKAQSVRNPQVNVNVESVGQYVTVDGQVQEPGLFPVLGRMTLMRAIARAKGATEFANTNYVVVFRDVNGKHMAGLYDLRAIRQGMYDDPEIYGNDVIYVGESGGRRVFQSIVQSGALLTAPLVAILNR